MPGKTGKQRATSIPLDYYKTADPLLKWRRRLALVALLVSVGWLATGLTVGGRWGLASNGRGRLRASRGPLARVHATWEAQCETCHVPFHPIGGVPPWARATGLDPKAADARCTTCHAGPTHHDAARQADVAACASCHRDHRGRDASLVRLPDKDCTTCHADLDAHLKPGARTTYAARVRSFFREGDHPEFRAVRESEGRRPADPGRLKFNHALHMSPGLTTVKHGRPILTLAQVLDPDQRARYRRPGQADTDPGRLRFNHALHMSPGLTTVQNGRPILTLAQVLDPDQRARYRRPGQADSDPVRLDCDSCHRPDLTPVRERGGGMAPIVYENQCAGCHVLQVPDGGDGPPLRVRHRLQPADLERELEAVYLARDLARDETVVDAPGPPRPVPGQRTPDPPTLRESLRDRVGKAGLILFGGARNTCTECHFLATADGRSTGLSRPMPGVPLADHRIEPTRVPAVWFRHAAFDHAPHRAVRCRECHAGAYAEGQGPGAPGPTFASTSAADVLLPGIATCRECHAPPSHADGAILGGAGHDCTECHTYHAGPPPDSPALGRVAPARDARAEMDLRQFLNGQPSGGTRQTP